MMSEAKKLATVFRAAADGIAKLAAPREVHAEYVAHQKKRVAEGIEIMNGVPDRYEEWITRLLSNRDQQAALVAFLAYNGIADLYEKVVEAEGAS